MDFDMSKWTTEATAGICGRNGPLLLVVADEAGLLSGCYLG